MTEQSPDPAASLADHLDEAREQERADLENELARQHAADERTVDALIAGAEGNVDVDH